MSLKNKIMLWMGVIGLLPLLVMSLESNHFGHQAIISSETTHLNFALKSRLIWLEEWLKFTRSEYLYAGLSSCPKDHEMTFKSSRRAVHRAIDSLAKGHANYELLAAFDADWQLIANAINHGEEPDRPPEQIKKRLEAGENFIVHPYMIRKEGQVLLQIGQPVFDADGHIFAYIFARLNMTKSLNRILGDSGDLGHTGKLYLVSDEGRYLSHSFDIKNVYGKIGSMPKELLQGPFWQVINYNDWQGVKVLGISAPVLDYGWVLIAEVDEADAFFLLNRAIVAGTLTGLVVLVIVFFLSLGTAKAISKPFREMAQVAQKVSFGNLGERMPAFKEEEPQKVSKAFNEMLARLAVTQQGLSNAVSLAAVGSLSSSIVHEMRNPLSSIKMNIQALSRKVKDDPAYAEMAELALSQSDRLEVMLADLLSFGKPLKLNLSPANFRTIAENAVKLHKKEAGKKGIYLDIDDGLGEQEISIDTELMERALDNLITNAIYWSPQEATIVIKGNRHEDKKEWLLISVIDKGPGMQEDQLEKVFMPFFTTRHEGTGLGLANVKKIIEHHGGTITAENNPDSGAAFTIIMPFKGV